MNKVSKFFLGIFIGAASLIITFRIINQAPSQKLNLDDKFRAIVDNSGCNMCHNPNPKLPFYAEWPLLGGKIKKEAFNASAKVDLTVPFRQFEEGNQVDNIALNKIEEVISNGSMPPFSFTILRPGSAISYKEEEILLEWIQMQRSRKDTE